ncbi:membrane protein [[Pantoea] beijingensis]|uniref:Membrane protein n=1 Tax=[Pantoea] beijingensis TaxID=1324864 RepID=A0A443IHC6_9GAMM|nr:MULTISPECIES: type IVB secretion system protein IcmH/DotU [Erwiniaceae]RWR03467.1 membrane protein [[Pantoea] beijingensis]
MTLETSAHDESPAGSENPLLSAAAPLLNAIVQIRLAATHDDPAGLRHQLIEEIRQFETRCKKMALPFETIIGTRYCLCSVLDEAAAQTPWGTRGVWSGNGLLATFHNESWGGEKFFQLLSRISQSPHQHLWLLEVIHYCLLLGYEGRYRGVEHGRTQRDLIRSRLAQLIETTRGVSHYQLDTQIVVRPSQQSLWRPPIPLWACITVIAFLGCLIYTGLNWRLGNAAEPLLRAIYQTPLPDMSTNRRASPAQALLDLHNRLNDLVSTGQAEVSDGPFGSRVILSSDRLFNDGATTLNTPGRALIARVAFSMRDVKGMVLVTAYTDNVLPGSSRFASNYEYSLALANSVASQLDQQLSPGHRVKPEGRGDSNPIATNDNQQDRARNRRIEITLFAMPTAGKPTQQGIR